MLNSAWDSIRRTLINLLIGHKKSMFDIRNNPDFALGYNQRVSSYFASLLRGRNRRKNRGSDHLTSQQVELLESRTLLCASIDPGNTTMVDIADATIAPTPPSGPTPEITSTSDSVNNDSPVSVTVDFGQPVTGFTVDDLSVVNAAVDNFVAGGDAYVIEEASSTFADISGTGTQVLVSSDSSSHTLTSGDLNGFAFELFGDTVPTIDFNANGWIQLNTTGVSGRIDVMNDDLVTDGGIFWEVQGSGDEQRLIIQWEEAVYRGQTGTVTFQAILHERDGLIELNYPDVMSDGASSLGANADIGLYLDGPGTPSLTYSVDADLTGIAAYNIYIDGGVFTFDLTPDEDGTVTVDIAADAATNVLDEHSQAATQFSFLSDLTAPTPGIYTSETDPTSATTIPVTVDFGEAVTGFYENDLMVTGATVSEFSPDSDRYSITAVDSTFFDISETGTQMLVGSHSGDFQITGGDLDGFVFEIEGQQLTTATIGAEGWIDFETAGDGYFLGVLADNLTTDGGVFWEIVGTGDNQRLIVQWHEAVYTGETGSITFQAILDERDGSITLNYPDVASDGSSSLGVDAEVGLYYRESEDYVVIKPDADLTGIAAYRIAQEATSVYTFNLVPDEDGTITVNLATGVARDTAGNFSVSPSEFSIVSDTQSPHPVITSTETGPTNADAIPISVDFGQAVTGFELDDLDIDGGTASNLTAVDAGYASEQISSTFVDISSTGSRVLYAEDVATHTLDATDLEGFEFTFYGQTYTQVHFSSNGLITFGTANSSDDNSDLESSPSQAAIAVLWDDLIATNGVYWEVQGDEGMRQLIIQWEDAIYFGEVGNITFQAILDESDGSIELNFPDLVNSDESSLGVYATVGVKAAGDQSENSAGFTLISEDSSLSGVEAYRITHRGSQIFTFDVTPTADGTVRIDIDAGAATNAESDDSLAAAQFTIVSDRTGPTPAISSSTSSPTNDSTIPVTVEFGEAVNGFDATDLTVVGASVSNFQSAPDHYVYEQVTSSFIDISETGTGVLNGVDDVAYTLGSQVLSGFQFSFFGETYNQVHFNSNGLITFGMPNDDYENDRLFTDPEEPAIAVLWNDLVTGGSVFWEVQGSGDHQRLIIQWDNATYYDEPGTITFQAILNEFDGSIELYYPDLASNGEGSNGAYATVGIKDGGDQSEDPNGRLLINYQDDLSGVAGYYIHNPGTTAYTFDLTPTGDGTITVDIAGAAATDLADNDSLAATQFSIVSDTMSPTPVITTTASDPTNLGSIPVTVDFGQDVTGFEADDLVVTGATVSGLPETLGGYAFEQVDSTFVDISATGTEILTGETDETDTLTDLMLDGFEFSIFGELYTEFQVTTFGEIYFGSMLSLVGESAENTVQIQSAIGVLSADLVATGGIYWEVRGNGSNQQLIVQWEDATFTGESGSVTFQAILNESDGSIVINYPDLVTSGPNSLGASAVVGVRNGEDFLFFSQMQSLAGVAAVRMALAQQQSFNFNLIPTGEGPITVDIAAGAAADIAGNNSLAATQLVIVSDTTSPEPTVTSSLSGRTNADTIPMEVDFGEEVVDFDADDITVVGGTVSNITPLPSQYYIEQVDSSFVDISGTGTQVLVGSDHGDYDLTTGDLNGFAFTLFGETFTEFQIETDGLLELGSLHDVAVLFVFTDDLVADGGVYWEVQGTGLEQRLIVQWHEATFFGETGTITFQAILNEVDGTVVYNYLDVENDGPSSLGVNALIGAANEFFTLSDSGDIVAESTLPDVSDGVGGEGGYFVFSDADNLEGISAFRIYESAENSAYSFDVTPTADGTITVDILADEVADVAGNENLASNQFTIVSDRTAPTPVISSTESSATNESPIPITVDFAESVTGFEASDISVTGGTLDSFHRVFPGYEYSEVSSGYVDISGTGTRIYDYDDLSDSYYEGILTEEDLDGFEFTAGGFSYQELLIAPEGYVIFFDSYDEPSFLTYFVPFVGDISPEGGVFWEVKGTGTNQQLIVEWHQSVFYGEPEAGGITFQVVLNENDGSVEFYYPDMTTSFGSAFAESFFAGVIHEDEGSFDFEEGYYLDILEEEDSLEGVEGFRLIPVEGDRYVFLVTPADEGIITVDIAANAATDYASNNSLAATQFSIEYDITAPTMSIGAPSAQSTTGSEVSYTVTYSGADSISLTDDDITLNATGTATGVVAITGSGLTTRTVTISNITGDGTLGISIDAASAEDLAGNESLAGGPTATFLVNGIVVQSEPATPSPAAATIDTTPTFNWSAVPGAVRYELWVNDQTVQQNRVLYRTDITETSYTPAAMDGFTPGHEYIWTVRGINVNDAVGSWGTHRTFTVDPILAPEELTSRPLTIDTTPLLSWTSVAGASHYDLWINDLTTGEIGVFRNQNVTGTSYSPELTDGHRYVWTVRGIADDGGVGGWGAYTYFTINTSVTPQTTGPVGQTLATKPTFGWVAIPGADRYDIWVNDVTTGQSGVIRNQDVTANSYTPTTSLVDGHTYLWTVRAINDDGGTTEWATHTSFSVNTSLKPTALSPITTTTPSTKPRFTWTAVKGAHQYDLWVNNLTTGQQGVIRNQNVLGTIYIPTTALNVSHEYTWTVRAINASGVEGAWATHATFSYEVLPAPALLAPTETVSSRTPTFTWNPVNGAARYDLWVNDLTTGQSAVIRNTNITGTSYLSTVTLINLHQYTWTVRAIRADNAAGTWAAQKTFTVQVAQLDQIVETALPNDLSDVPASFDTDDDAGETVPEVLAAVLGQPEEQSSDESAADSHDAIVAVMADWMNLDLWQA